MTYHEELLEFKRKYWTDLLARCGHNVSAVARIAGVNRNHLYKLTARLGVPFKRKGRCGNRGNAIWKSIDERRAT